MATIVSTIDETGSADAVAPLTVAELVERLGGIPLDRIWLQPPPGTATEHDVIKTRLCELIDGTIVGKAVGFFESMLGMMLGHVLQSYLDDHDYGFTVGSDCHIRFGDQIREPDVAFVTWDRVPGGRVPDTPVGEVAPDLAVEILSRGNTKAEMERKRHVYFTHGVRLVWIADPRKRTVEVWTDAETCRTLDENGVLEDGDVLPGFSLPIREWFERTEQRLRKPNT